ncbi:MAG: hypothetical protein IT237_13210 [Bacteroidia bacterium]|nr:hypothetical protein [Bacteroidia bacterium]
MKIIYALAIILMSITFSTKLYSQEKRITNNNSTLEQVAQKKYAEKKNALKTKQVTSSSRVGTSNYKAIDENDSYLGKKEEYLRMITLNELPSDFPKYQKGMSFVEYDNLTNQYFKNHISILKEAYRAKF